MFPDAVPVRLQIDLTSSKSVLDTGAGFVVFGLVPLESVLDMGTLIASYNISIEFEIRPKFEVLWFESTLRSKQNFSHVTEV